MLPLLNVADYARAARAKLSKEVCDYIEGGALDEITLRENTTSWERLKLYYHVLAGVGARDTRTTVLGRRVPRVLPDRGRAWSAAAATSRGSRSPVSCRTRG